MSPETPSFHPSHRQLIRGDAADRAQSVNLLNPVVDVAIQPVGHWAQEVDEIRQAACSEGRAEGYAVGVAEGRRDTAAHLDGLSKLVDSTLARIEPQTQELFNELAAGTVDLALQIAAAVVQRELACASDPGADAIARCLQLAPDAGAIVARLHPDDAATFSGVVAASGRELAVVADPGVAIGDAVVTVNDTTIESCLADAMQRVAEVLR